MLIGKDFNEKSRQLIETALRIAGSVANVMVSVDDINAELGFERQEIRNILDYLQDLGYVRIETIGGSFLYGHLSITEKGVTRFNKAQG